MPSVVAERPKKVTRRRGAVPTDGWWGNEPPVSQQWPGVTIDIPAVWRSATSRWETVDGQYFFDRVEADRACSFFPLYLRHHIGEFVGLPFDLLGYQRLLLTSPLFGWKRTTDGMRRFRKVFGFLPKGAGKSPWGAGTGLYLAFCDKEAGAEVYAVAADKNQARTVHDNARIMVEAMIEIEPEFSGMLTVLRDAIECAETHSKYQVISADASTKHGFRPHGVIFDEFHAQKNRNLYEALKKSMVKRRQPMMVIITHAGDDDENICYEEYEYGKGVLSGTIQDDTCLPVIFEAMPDEDWTDPVVWRRVNPGHGITVKTDGIAAECAEAKAEPRKLNDFLRFHLNRWVNQATAWIPVDWWDACREPIPSDDELRKYPCAVGIDMAQKIDLASAVVGFRLPLEHESADTVDVVNVDDAGVKQKRTLSLDFRVVLLPAFWLPEDTLQEHVRTDHVPYNQLAKDGLLHVVDGAIIGADPIVRYLVDLQTRFPRLKSAQHAYDPAFATEVALALRDRFNLTTVEVLQNYKHLSEACQVFEALVKSGRIIHGGHRLLRWNLENVAIKSDDPGRIRPVKPRSRSKRIDGIVAAIMVISRLMLMPPEQPRKHKGALLYAPGGWVPALPPSQEAQP